MSEVINDGGPAFPITDASVMHRVGMAAVEAITDPGERDKAYIAATAQFAQGMTLRDHFASQAIQGVFEGGLPDKLYCEVVAKRAYELADAMIRARDGGAA
ncbi:hypothetical protein [Acidovorax sp. CCYZU-2555]|uniref:hypothetical protein n=1 Tax=Acidovorax sp. CCYZU-2555 TaxID=2835042 RepID=UPI001BD09546|nr:hypothetical protein [Acidovorax sp. CCYZU-2555]MBS7777660.1 hypothetical protein [Acidovorax sp. CCYZU-2555]